MEEIPSPSSTHQTHPTTSFVILLHCSILNEVEPVPHQQTTIGVLSTDSLLVVKNTIFQKISSFKAYIFQLSSGEYLFDERSEEGYLSTTLIGHFMTPQSSKSAAHLAIIIANRVEFNTQITTPSLKAKEERDCMYNENSAILDECENPILATTGGHIVENENPVPNIGYTIEDNNRNRDTDILKIIYKILVFCLLIRADAGAINVLTLIFISFLLIMNHFKLLNFCVKPRPPHTSSMSVPEQSLSNNIFYLVEEAKYIMVSFVMSAFPTCVVTKSVI